MIKNTCFHMCACMYADVMYILPQHYGFVHVIKINIFKVIGGIPYWEQPSCTEATAQVRAGPTLCGQ